jgi:hypothetical protein
MEAGRRKSLGFSHNACLQSWETGSRTGTYRADPTYFSNFSHKLNQQSTNQTLHLPITGSSKSNHMIPYNTLLTRIKNTCCYDVCVRMSICFFVPEITSSSVSCPKRRREDSSMMELASTIIHKLIVTHKEAESSSLENIHPPHQNLLSSCNHAGLNRTFRHMLWS